MLIKGTVKSKTGFYIGDVCYALPEHTYHKVWGGAHYADGKYHDDEKNGDFMVAGTAIGDGEYYDQTGWCYPVDGGNIGIVPLELVDGGGFAKTAEGLMSDPCGRFEYTPGEATFEAEDGVFDITLPDGRSIIINTADLAVGFDDDDDYDDDTRYW